MAHSLSSASSLPERLRMFSSAVPLASLREKSSFLLVSSPVRSASRASLAFSAFSPSTSAPLSSCPLIWAIFPSHSARLVRQASQAFLARSRASFIPAITVRSL